jgi:hypothetical protein
VSRILLIAVACVCTAHAQSPAEPFLAELQTALRSGDRAAVVARIQYPITVRIAGLRVPFADSAALLARYDDIFTPTLIDTIARVRAPTVKDDSMVLANYNLVIQRIDQQWKITAIAVPPAEPAEQGGGAHKTDPTDAANTARSTRPQAPTRVGIRSGPRPTQFPGSLLPGATDVYLLWVPKGRVLEVRLDRVQGRAALVRVVHAKTGAPFNPRLAGGARVVAGVAPESADYRIEVRRAEGADSAPLPYMVSLTLR